MIEAAPKLHFPHAVADTPKETKKRADWLPYLAALAVIVAVALVVAWNSERGENLRLSMAKAIAPTTTVVIDTRPAAKSQGIQIVDTRPAVQFPTAKAKVQKTPTLYKQVWRVAGYQWKRASNGRAYKAPIYRSRFVRI